eukprot:2800053-Rhodomonas_salina.1
MGVPVDPAQAGGLLVPRASLGNAGRRLSNGGVGGAGGGGGSGQKGPISPAAGVRVSAERMGQVRLVEQRACWGEGGQWVRLR